MTLGAAAVVRPLRITDGTLLHAPMLAMIAALVVVLTLSTRRRTLHRTHGFALLAAYSAFMALAVLT